MAVAVAAVAVVAALALPRLAGDGDDTTVRAGPSDVPIIGQAALAAPRVEMALQAGWQTLLAEGETLVVGTRPLVERDLHLAVLARDDVAFSAFPVDGVVLVVGGDRLQAKYVGDPSRATRTTTADGSEEVHMGTDAFVGPGPALALGPAKPVSGGITVRRGDVPKSTRTLAGYFGPGAAAALTAQAEAMAATVRIPPLDQASMPPPPPGSRPSFDSGGPPAGTPLSEVASFTMPGAVYTARAGGNCADVVAGGSPQPLAGGCSPGRLTGNAVHVTAVSFNLGSPPVAPPGQTFAPGRGPVPPATIVLARAGPEVRSLVAVLVDGRTIPAALGRDGWALVAAGARPYLLEVRDTAGKAVTYVPVT